MYRVFSIVSVVIIPDPYDYMYMGSQLPNGARMVYTPQTSMQYIGR